LRNIDLFWKNHNYIKLRFFTHIIFSHVFIATRIFLTA
jgi:hypothetical protein